MISNIKPECQLITMIRKNIRCRIAVGRSVTSAEGECDAEVVELDVAQYGGPRTATPGELTAPTPGEPTAEPRWWQRAWRRMLPPPEAIPDQHHELTQQL